MHCMVRVVPKLLLPHATRSLGGAWEEPQNKTHTLQVCCVKLQKTCAWTTAMVTWPSLSNETKAFTYVVVLCLIPRPSSFRLLYSIPKQWGTQYISSCVEFFLGRQREEMTRTMKPSVALFAGGRWHVAHSQAFPLQFLITYKNNQSKRLKAQGRGCL